MSRRRYIALAVVALVIGGAVYAWKHFPRDNTARATAGQALLMFRRDVERYANRLDRVPGFPELGVYRYATRGGENLDTAILSTGHDYGGVSTIAIAPASCGVEERWQVLTERWTEAEVCREATGLRLKSLREHHEFFGVTKAMSYACKGGTLPDASELRAGMRWVTKCASRNGSISNATRMMGVERVKVAGRVFDAAHTRSNIVLEGENSGTGERNEWRRRLDGLLLRRTVSIEASFDILGSGRYSESYSLELLSPDPRR
ncbi:MAG: hypothetical protein FVQ78_00295 [Solirubrobacterales bacterium]|nr:hypothetical protein [Solirubrobacterales bacterium]